MVQGLPITVVDELHEAAVRLRELAQAAQSDLKSADAWAQGLINSFGGPGAMYAAVLPPAVGLALADWLDQAAREEEAAQDAARAKGTTVGPYWPHLVVTRDALAVARGGQRS